MIKYACLPACTQIPVGALTNCLRELVSSYHYRGDTKITKSKLKNLIHYDRQATEPQQKVLLDKVFQVPDHFCFIPEASSEELLDLLSDFVGLLLLYREKFFDVSWLDLVLIIFIYVPRATNFSLLVRAVFVLYQQRVTRYLSKIYFEKVTKYIMTSSYKDYSSYFTVPKVYFDLISILIMPNFQLNVFIIHSDREIISSFVLFKQTYILYPIIAF